MNIQAKPFLQWVGGKKQLIGQLEQLLPVNLEKKESVTYIEPFIGGGAMLFYMLQKYPNIKKAVINDVNPDLITCYRTIRDNVELLIQSLSRIQTRYCNLPDIESKKAMYLENRQKYNEKGLDPIENSTLFIFLNRTCFNALYRTNKKGEFNVSFGTTKKDIERPLMFDSDILRADSELLKRVTILEGDFENVSEYVNKNTLIYFDPPYRPLSTTSSFNSYAKESFNDDAQVRLKKFCDFVTHCGGKLLLSNSDCKGENENCNYFENLYKGYDITRVYASRSVNCDASKRGKISELVIRNYTNN